MTRSFDPRWAARATVGLLAGLAVFQVALALGAPLGEAAWGGTHGARLPAALRLASLATILLYAAVAAVVMRQAGYAVPGVSGRVARPATRVVAGLIALSGAANLLSGSAWERYLLGPVSLVLASLCMLVARDGMEHETAAPRGR